MATPFAPRPRGFSGFVDATAEICFAVTLTLGFAVRRLGILAAQLTV